MSAGSTRFYLPKCSFQIGEKRGKGPLDRPLPGDQNIVGSSSSAVRQDPRGSFAQPSLRAIANYRVADPSARGKPDPDVPGLIASSQMRRRLQNKTGARDPATGGCHSKEISPDF
jgi:hypothetical protein